MTSWKKEYQNKAIRELRGYQSTMRRILKTQIGSRKKYLKYRLQYGKSTPKPWELIDINPNNIYWMNAPRHIHNHDISHYHILNGEWDRNYEDSSLIFSTEYEDNFNKTSIIPLQSYVFLQSAERYLENNIGWMDTQLCQWANSNSSLTEKKRNSIFERKEKLDRLFTQIDVNGYKTQRELGKLDPTNEIMVNIGRDGKIIFEEGKHRLAVVRCLNIESVPVRVFVRHPDWVKKRRRLAEADSETEISSELYQHIGHPDIKSIVSFRS